MLAEEGTLEILFINDGVGRLWQAMLFALMVRQAVVFTWEELNTTTPNRQAIIHQLQSHRPMVVTRIPLLLQGQSLLETRSRIVIIIWSCEGIEDQGMTGKMTAPGA